MDSIEGLRALVVALMSSNTPIVVGSENFGIFSFLGKEAFFSISQNILFATRPFFGIVERQVTCYSDEKNLY